MANGLSASSVKIGKLLARKLFEKRGNRSEAHLCEFELALALALAAELAVQRPRVLSDEDAALRRPSADEEDAHATIAKIEGH
jgi:hypothetical protein